MRGRKGGEGGTNKRQPSKRSEAGTVMSSKKSSRTGVRWLVSVCLGRGEEGKGESRVECKGWCTLYALHGGGADLAEDDFAFEGPEDDETELDWSVRDNQPVISLGARDVPERGGRNVPFTFTMPVPWPMRPSDALRRSYMQMHRPIFCITWTNVRLDDR